MMTAEMSIVSPDSIQEWDYDVIDKATALEMIRAV